MIEARLIESIKASVDLVTLIGATVPLKRSGKDFVGLCPFHQDHHPSFYVVPSKGIWHCFPCGASGDAVEWLVRRGLSFQEAISDLASRVGQTVEHTHKPEPPPPRPPADDVASFWAACRKLEDARSDDPAIPWLRDWRKLDVPLMGLQDLCRLTPRTGRFPSWVPHLGMERLAWATLYRLTIPLFDSAGTLRALRFRAVDRTPCADGWSVRDIPKHKKSIASFGTASRGLVIADSVGRALLKGSTTVDGVSWDGRVVIAEGEPDAWTWATTARKAKWEAEQAHNTFSASTWATFGYVVGAWTQDLASRIPDGATVIIRRHLDDNEAGQRMAQAIVDTFDGRRVQVLWRRRGEG